MLNTVLTVRKGDANSHQKKGWEEFTSAIIRVLSKKDNLVYLLWGIPASKKCEGIDSRKNVIITSSHPSPLGATKTSSPFIGSKCFSRTNEALKQYGKEEINWQL
jgi:uracil-DNA glycosylase